MCARNGVISMAPGPDPSPTHLILEDVQQRVGIPLIYAPYKGNAPWMQDIGGRAVDFAVLVYSAAMEGLAEQGRVKINGQLGAQRSELLKNVPTASKGKELKTSPTASGAASLCRRTRQKPWSNVCTRPSAPP